MMLITFITQIRNKLKKFKDYCQENKKTVILVVLLVLTIFFLWYRWSTSITNLEEENRTIQFNRAQLEALLKEKDKKVLQLQKEKLSLKDSLTEYEKEKNIILIEKEKNKAKYKQDLEKIKKETLLEDQQWWDTEGKRLIKKYGL